MMGQTYRTTMRTLAAAAALLLSSCADWVQGKIPMDSDLAHGSLDELLVPEEKITELAAPAELFASQGLYAGKISLTWKEVPGATSYKIWRIVKTDNEMPDTEEFTDLLKEVYGSVAYEDTILLNPTATSAEYGNFYFYCVTAENVSSNLVSAYSSPAAGWLMPAPKNVEAEKGESTESVTITWSPVPGANSYTVWRTTNSAGYSMAKIATVPSNHTAYKNIMLTNEQGTEFYYQIAAQIGANSSAPSSLAMGYSLMDGAPQAVKNVRVVNGIGTDKTRLTVEWDEGAPASDEGTITYSVYRTSSEDSAYLLVAEKIKADVPTFTDRPDKTGVYYYYFIQVVEAKPDELGEGTVELKSSFSKSGPTSDSPAFGCLLSPPSSVECEDAEAEDMSKLKWTPAIGSEVEGVEFKYRIYGSENKSSWQLLESAEPSQEGGTFVCEVPRHTFYMIRTYNPAAGIESVNSGMASPSPNAPTNVRASKTEDLTTYPPNKYGVYPVKITWTPPAGDDISYYVYRSTKPDSAFIKLTSKPIQETEYIDINTAAKAGTYYYYKVVSLNSLEQGSKGNDPANDPNNDARGYGALTAEQWFREYDKNITSSQAKLSLMHKPNNLDKVGSETINGAISGTLGYTASVQGLSARIIMPYKNYADFYIPGTTEPIFILNGNTNTTSNISANGTMDGTVACTGMYPGEVKYDYVQVKGGAAGGGYYPVTTKDLEGNVIFDSIQVDWTVGDDQ
ncbi:MAG: hypothetical protein K2H09_04955 [Treponemataceae bacterium]|nr:hypothetical protein [Treponemataceae bacterium]